MIPNTNIYIYILYIYTVEHPRIHILLVLLIQKYIAICRPCRRMKNAAATLYVRIDYTLHIYTFVHIHKAINSTLPLCIHFRRLNY